MFVDYGRTIAFYRKRARYSQRELGRACGMQGIEISMIERGMRMPGIVVLSRIIEALGGKVQFVFPKENAP